MNRQDDEARLIEQYQQDERMMILAFAQWCATNGLDPETLYERAYPNQPKNEELQEAVALIADNGTSPDIPDEALLSLLSMYGNDDLAFEVSAAIDDRRRSRK
jgi:hypothetical protein